MIRFHFTNSFTLKNKRKIKNWLKDTIVNEKKKVGDIQFKKYRRSWEIAPPIINKEDKNLKLFSPLNASIPDGKIPLSESLKDTYERVVPFFLKQIKSKLQLKKNILISAHGNSLRALCKYLFKISDEEINSLEIPTGNPMIINFLDNLKIDNATYLDKERAKPINNLD